MYGAECDCLKYLFVKCQRYAILLTVMILCVLRPWKTLHLTYIFFTFLAYPFGALAFMLKCFPNKYF